MYGYELRWFSPWKPKKIVVILRRAADDRSVRKALGVLGIKWSSGREAEGRGYYEKGVGLSMKGCRVLVLNWSNNSKEYSLSYTSYIVLTDSPKSIREHYASQEDCVILNTKPSVKQAINILKSLV